MSGNHSTSSSEIAVAGSALCSLVLGHHCLVPSTALCVTGGHDILTTPSTVYSLLGTYMEAAGCQACLYLERVYTPSMTSLGNTVLACF